MKWFERTLAHKLSGNSGQSNWEMRSFLMALMLRRWLALRESVFAAEDSENGRSLQYCLHEKADFFGYFLLCEEESEPKEFECPCLTWLNDDESSESVWVLNSLEVTSPTFFCESCSSSFSMQHVECSWCLDLTLPQTEVAACSLQFRCKGWCIVRYRISYY